MTGRMLRQKPRISYYEPEEPSLDEYIFCDECADFVYEYCAIHGPLLVIPDDKVPSKSPYPAYVPRAALTIPHVFLHLAPSIIPGAGLGVFSTLTLPRGVRFGPYSGQKTEQVDSMYCWQIYDRNNKRSHVVDAADANRSNWMRYVNCARHWKEQNLLAYQYQGQLYYRTIKIIPRFTELMVFYGSEFANKLHINISKYNSPPGFAQKFGAPAAKKPKPDTQTNKAQTYIQTKNNAEDSSSSKNKKKIQKEEKKISYKRKKNNFKPVSKNENVIPIKPKDCIIAKENISPVLIEISKSDFNCTICNYKGVNKSDLERHNLRHQNMMKETRYKCDICQRGFTEKGSLIRHMRTHTGEKPFKCDICQKRFIQKSDLITHLRTHTGEKPFKCDICQKRFIQKSDLIKHLRTHTGEKPFKCDICQRRFIQKSDLIKHLRTHTGEKPYKCDICHNGFNQRGHLITHLRTHTGEKPFKCDICQRRFSEKGSLIKHVRIHTGEKPFKCYICQRRFNQRSNLIKHVRIHTSEKPYKCDICQKRFNQKSDLINHLRTHTGEKPYKCDICQRRFSVKGSLITHLRTHTGEKPNKCKIKKIFKSND